MIRFLLVPASMAALALGACATSAQSERQEMVDAGQRSGVTSDGDAVRCQTIRPTGSRMSERVCLTQRQWDEMEESASRLVEDRGANSQTALPSRGGGAGG